MNIPSGSENRCFPSQLSNVNDSTIIGYSALQREIRAWRIGSELERPTLIVAGQHGDEACAMLAAAKVIRTCQPAGNKNQPAAWIIPCLNPDATVENKRRNAQGMDLNRDHLARLSPEVRCLHDFIRKIKPNCVLDLHCFPSRRRWMKKLNVEHAADLLVDWSTGPAGWLADAENPNLLSLVSDQLQKNRTEALNVSRYWLLSRRGRLRHSTPDWLDLRNQVAACYRIPTYLIEGREPLPNEIGQAERTIEAMVLAVHGILCAHQIGTTTNDDVSKSLSNSDSTLMPTSFKYESSQPIQTCLRDRDSHQIYVHPIGKKHSDCVIPSRYVRVARELWIPKSLSGVIGHLLRLKAPLHEGADQLHKISQTAIEVVQLTISGRQTSKRRLRNQRKVRVTKTKLVLSDPQQFLVLIPSADDRIYWSSLLDPRHKFSICRMHRQELCTSYDNRYPVLFRYEPQQSNAGSR